MILPTLRASFGRDDALHLVELVARSDDDLRTSLRSRLEEEGMDSLLDDPRALNALLSDADVKLTPAQVFYVLIRQALLEAGVEDRGTADYVASMVVRFGDGRRAYRIEDGAEDEFRYLVDMVVRLSRCGEREAFLLRTHLGNYALWITGLFPDFVEARVHRRGAPPVRYYEEMGTVGYRMASESREARSLGMEQTLSSVARDFPGARRALNQVADRYLWRDGSDPVGRLLREMVSQALPES
jgi:hypothetical protein